MTIILELTAIGLNKFKTIATFRNLFHSDQLEFLNVGENTLHCNNFIVSTLQRVVLYDSQNMKLKKLK